MNQPPVIYLASPYSSPHPEVMKERFEQACKAAATLIKNGAVVFSPIAHSHNIAETGRIAGDWATWERQCIAMLDRCDFMLVLMLDGWHVSKGIKAEVKHCHKTKKRIIYSDMEEVAGFVFSVPSIAA